MPISERILKKWRIDALRQKRLSEKDADFTQAKLRRETAERILKMTQELLDQHLLGK